MDTVDTVAMETDIADLVAVLFKQTTDQITVIYFGMIASDSGNLVRS